VPIDAEPPELSAPLPDPFETLAADAAGAEVTGAHGHHGPFHTHCENCGTKLDGPWCHKCGQHDFEFHRSFGHVFLEALENFFHFDSKLFHNIVTLLFSPGRLTADFNAGKRAAQMPPFRLYLFVSILFFFISFVGSHLASDLNLDDSVSAKRQAAVRQMLDQSLAKITRETSDAAVQARAERAIQRLREANDQPGAKPLDLLKVEQAVTDEIRKEETGPAPATPPAAPDTKPDRPIVRPVDPNNLHLTINPRNDSALNRFLVERGLYAYTHQRELVESFIHALPKMLLFCLPFFALFTRVLFRQSGQVYLQHLVLALHFHTFIFLWVLVRNGWGFLAGFAGDSLKGWLIFGCNLWLVLYPLLMLRRLFANSWPKTIVKTGLLGAAYTFTLGLGFLGTAVILFALL
jgi:hypothetical protein